MKKKEVRVMQDLLGSNQKIADTLRTEFSARGTLIINLVSSPGAGKTTLLEYLAGQLTPKYKMAVIEGDIETERDADRIRAKGIPAWQIMTGGACHLDAKMIGKLYTEIPTDLDFLFIENVGNLVCTAGFDLGENIRLVLLSTPEGDDKPKKYPNIFVTSQCLIISKVDLVPPLPFDIAYAQKEALEVNPKLKIFTTSAQTGAGIDELVDFLIDSLQDLRKNHA
jgi:hydrogenase nickel incorporation protein HypB